MPLKAANRTALPKMVIGKIICDVGDTALGRIGVKTAKGANGSASAMHINALESAPPKLPV